MTTVGVHSRPRVHPPNLVGRSYNVQRAVLDFIVIVPTIVMVVNFFRQV